MKTKKEYSTFQCLKFTNYQMFLRVSRGLVDYEDFKQWSRIQHNNGYLKGILENPFGEVAKKESLINFYGS